MGEMTLDDAVRVLNEMRHRGRENWTSWVGLSSRGDHDAGVFSFGGDGESHSLTPDEAVLIAFAYQRRDAEAVRGEAGPMTRDQLGRIVREAWVKWARTQPNPKASWLVPYDALSEADKEADRQIGEAVFALKARPGPATRRVMDGLARWIDGEPDSYIVRSNFNCDGDLCSVLTIREALRECGMEAPDGD